MRDTTFSRILASRFLLILFAATGNLIFQYSEVRAQTSKIRIEEREMGTYSFSDPDPVPNIGYIYPYFRFDGYTNNKEMRAWKMIILENDYISVFITPEIGGKIWGAIEKSTGKEFIYYNKVVKFRDIAMRGAWTSGGIETNFGIIGHTPTVSTPVNYQTRENEDGSVSCFIGATDLTSGTIWRMEINLPSDKAWFSTKATWYNPTKFSQSYYHWMNAAVKTSGNLEYAYPGTNYIGHDGSVHSWPITKEGIDISWYENNNFGGYKSYHVLSSFTNFYGGYYHDDDFGFGHYADYDEKPGKKLWIWGLSDQGMIWEKLLTDSDGQYTEVQSGRLFNQEASSSIFTPFKHREFIPGTIDSWEELWFPIKDTKGAIQAIPEGVINFEQRKDSLDVFFNANEHVDSDFLLEFEGANILEEHLELKPTETFKTTIPFGGDPKKVSAKLGYTFIIPPGGVKALELERPLNPIEFDWNTAYGKYLMGKQMEEERKYQEAEKFYKETLSREPQFLPSLYELGNQKLRRRDYDSAMMFVRDALAIDTYSPEANFAYAAINEELGNSTDAMEGYSIASLSPDYRDASYAGISRLYLQRDDFKNALKYCNKSLSHNNQNVVAREYKIVALRKMDRKEEAMREIKRLTAIDPLNHLSKFEHYLNTSQKSDLDSFLQNIRNEFPAEVYLELAIKYFEMGAAAEAMQVLGLAPESPVVLYWLAYLQNEKQGKRNKELIRKADGMDPMHVFPYRRETADILEWIMEEDTNWKPKYYLGLIEWNLGNVRKAQEIFSNAGMEPNFYPYYLARAELYAEDKTIVEESLNAAVKYGSKDWRTGYALAGYYYQQKDFEKAKKAIEDFVGRYPNNYYLGLQYAGILIELNENLECFNLLKNLKVLPNEGATRGRLLYRQVNLNLAAESYFAKKYEEALEFLTNARSWPESLGVGRPYTVDESLEDYLEARALQGDGNEGKAIMLYEKIVNISNPSAENKLLKAASLKHMGKAEDATDFVESWIAEDRSEVAVWCREWLSKSKVREASFDDDQVHWIVNFLTKDR